MIAQSVVEEVRRLLADGRWSQRTVAKMAGVSRGTVGSIASGKRPDPPQPREAWQEELDERAGPPRRCEVCGGLVYLPCRLCHVREVVARLPMDRDPDVPGESTELELSDQHGERYQRVRALRIRAKRDSDEA